MEGRLRRIQGQGLVMTDFTFGEKEKMQTGKKIPAEARLLAGTESPTSEAWEPFAADTVGFLDAFSKALRGDARACMDPETMALAFWCRRAHLETLRRRHFREKPAVRPADREGRPLAAAGSAQRKTGLSGSEEPTVEDGGHSGTAGSGRMGRGLLFHLAPANVPMMFVYTWAIGLLAGNAGIVRISERTIRMEAVRDLLRVLNGLLDREEYEKIRARISLITYEHDDALTEEILSHCDGRILWGGDETIRQLRRIPMPPRAVELAFPDRVSLAVIREAGLKKLDDDAVCNLVHRFYNDTYVMDQNGCSSPQTVIWLRDPGTDPGTKAGPRVQVEGGSAHISGMVSGEIKETGTGDECAPASPADGSGQGVREKWWELLAQEAEAAYELDGFRAARKLEKAALAVMREAPQAPHVQVTAIRRFHGNALYVLRLSELPPDLAGYRGGFGLFYEAEAETEDDIFRSFSDRIQTVVCVGVEPAKIAAAAARAHSAGVLRFVEAGQALQMDTVWDGIDLIAALSRRTGEGPDL